MFKRGQIKMCDADREAYGGPEWLDVNPSTWEDMSFKEIDELERAMNVSLVQLLEVEIPAYTARGAKAVLWIGLRAAGVTVPWKDFAPKVLKVKGRKVPMEVGDDADPPKREDSTASTDTSDDEPFETSTP